MQCGRDPLVWLRDEFRIDREALDQHLAGVGSRGREPVERRPRPLGIDVVGRHRRNAAPIVDAGVDQARQRAVGEIGRRLDIHRGAEQDARHRDRPEMIIERWLGMLRHAGAGLGAEILDDDFLQMVVALVQVAQRQQRRDALAPRLADADQDAGGERHTRFTGRRNRREPRAWQFVGRAEMRSAAM